jgi:hypothetical protein
MKQDLFHFFVMALLYTSRHEGSRTSLLYVSLGVLQFYHVPPLFIVFVPVFLLMTNQLPDDSQTASQSTLSDNQMGWK